MTPPGPANNISGSGRGSMADSRTAYELKDIPLLKSVIGIYSRTKSSNAILTFGCSFAEKGVGIVVDTVVVTTGCGDIVDTVTSGLVSRVKDNYPIIQRTPEKIYKKTKLRASRYIRRRTKSALRTSVGQTVLSALDAITEISDEAYKFLNHYTILNRDRNMKVPSKMEKHVQTDLISPTKSSRGQQTKLTGADDQWVKQLTQEDKQIVEPVFSLSYIIMVPLELFTRFLRYLQAKLHALAGTHYETRRSNRRKNGGHPITPEKTEEIVARRKVSPKKRINSSIIGNIKSVAFRMLGFDSSCVKQTDIRQFLSCSKHRPLNLSPVMSGDDTEKKRKHDDILSDTEEESDDEDMVNMNLKKYISDEDPDYEPTDEEESDVSIDSNEEYDESDFDTEETEGLVMMKDKENAKPVETKPKDTKPIELKPKESEKKPVIPLIKENENLKAKTSPKKAVLSPKKHTNTNNQPALIITKSPTKPPTKPFGGKEEKKDVNQKYGSSVDQVKQPEVVNKPSTTPNTGNVEKQHGNKKF